MKLVMITSQLDASARLIVMLWILPSRQDESRWGNG
jgi:hypothetical protein